MERLDRSENHSTGERAGLGFIVWFILFILTGMVTVLGVFFVTPVKDTLYANLASVGILGWVIAIIVGISFAFIYLKDKWKNRGIKYDKDGYRIWNPEPKQDSIIISFIKASYNKYCPKIDWDHKK